MSFNLVGLLGSLGGGFLTGIGNIASQAMANKANMQAVRENNQLQRELAEYQWNKNLEMWNLQNQYNSPVSQMQRYKDAGLNPHLIYGQGNSGNASSMPSYQSPTTQAVTRNAIKFGNFGMALDLLQKYQNIRIGQQQEHNLATANDMAIIDQQLKFDKNLREWHLFPLNRSIKDAIYNQTVQNTRLLGQKTISAFRENQFWEKYGFSPNSQFGNFFGAGMKLYDYIKSLINTPLNK